MEKQLEEICLRLKKIEQMLEQEQMRRIKRRFAKAKVQVTAPEPDKHTKLEEWDIFLKNVNEELTMTHEDEIMPEIISEQ